MPLLDFDSLVICNERLDRDSLIKTLTYFRSVGIKNFIISCGIDIRDQSTHFNKIFIADTKKYISNIKVRGAKIRFIPHIHIHKGTAYDFYTPHLKVWNSNVIFLQAPLLPDANWFDPEINFFLYKLKLKPVFVGYETALSTNYITTEKLFKSANADFCFDISYITSEQYEFRIHQAMTYGSTIIPCISYPLKSYGNVLKQFSKLRMRMGDITYLKLCRHINISCQKLWNSI